MPSHSGPNTKGEENLVFSYDLGDVSNSYKGEPTTNLITHVLPNNSWVTNGAGTIITENYGYDPNGILRSSKIVDNPNSGNGAFAYTSALNVPAGTYTFSAKVKTSTAGASANCYMRLYDMDPITNLGTTTFTNLIPGVWTKVAVTGVLASGTTKIAPHFHTATGNTADFIEVVDVQLEQNSHATQFTPGTRSATQGLLDHTGNSTIDISNVSFDSDAQMTFDGTDDVVTLQGTENFKSQSPFTLEIWTYVTAFDAGGSMFMFQQNSGTYGGFEFWSQTSGVIRLNANSSVNLAATPSGAFTLNNWNHVVATVDGTTASIYVNGELKRANSAGFPDSVNGNIKVGDWALEGYRVNGDIPAVKIYNKALTAEEIKSNYNAIKGRFNI